MYSNGFKKYMVYTHIIITSLERRYNDDDVVCLKTFFGSILCCKVKVKKK